MSQIAQQLANVRRRILQAATLAGREVSSIQLLAVSKTHPVTRIQAAIEAGQRAFGESYVQEAIPKIEAIAKTRDDIEWHYIGPIQANKTAAIARHFPGCTVSTGSKLPNGSVSNAPPIFPHSISASR